MLFFTDVLCLELVLLCKVMTVLNPTLFTDTTGDFQPRLVNSDCVREDGALLEQQFLKHYVSIVTLLAFSIKPFKGVLWLLG